MWIWPLRVHDLLKNKKKIQFAGGRDRTPDLQPLGLLWPMWKPLKHVVVWLIIIYEKQNIWSEIKKRAKHLNGPMNG